MHCKICGQQLEKGWHRMAAAKPANGENVLLLMPEGPSEPDIIIAFIYDTEWASTQISTRFEVHPRDLWRHLPRRRHKHHSQDWSK